jgi:metal-dependent amidase/aminoacylase/carboxypeptidase family protein
VDFDLGSPPVVNDAELIDIIRETILEERGSDAIFDIPVPSMGAEDFAHYLDHIPGALIRIGTRNSPDTAHVLHDSRFDIDETAMTPASILLGNTIVNLLQRKASLS